MNWMDKCLFIWLLFCGLAIACFVMVAEDSAGVDRPSGKGPYHVGYYEDNYTAEWRRSNVDSFTMEVGYYYPAISDGDGAEPDHSAAFYPTVINSPNSKWQTDLYVDKSLNELLSSWGMIIVTYSDDARVNYSRITDYGIEWFYPSLLNHIEDLNETEGNPLFGMVDKEAFGASGFDFGADAAWICTSSSRNYYNDFRIKAVFSMHHSLSYDENPDWIGAFTKYGRGWTKKYAPPCAYMAQIGTYNPEKRDNQEVFDQNRWHFYRMKVETSHPNALVVVKGENFAGPYRMDYWISFLLYWLDGREEYRTLLYGEEAIMEAADGRTVLSFNFDDGDIFPPDGGETKALKESVLMDEPVILWFNVTGHPVYEYDGFQVKWEVNGTGGIITPFERRTAFYQFDVPGTYSIQSKWSLGDLSGELTPVTVEVINLPPVVIPGPNGVLSHDTEVVFDGSASYDTESHMDKLEYRWVFSDGEETEYSSDPTWTKKLTSVEQYTAILWVRDPLGSEQCATCVIDVKNMSPYATADPMKGAVECETLAFNGRGTDTPSHIWSLQYKWEFGDGSETGWTGSPATNHTYAQKGTYRAILRVRDPLGAEGNDTIEVTVDNVPPEGGIEEPKAGAKRVRDTSVVFLSWGNDTLSDFGSLVYTWDFGDGETAEGATVSHTYMETGIFTVNLTIEDNDGATFVVTQNLSIREKTTQSVMSQPQAASLVVGLITIFGLAAVAATEPGKYWFGLLGAPLFTKVEDVLDNKTRHALLGIIVANPGIHYTAIKEEFGLANGQAAYHLDVLEREGFIRSARDGKLKRFYSAYTKVPKDLARSPEEMREAIVELVRRTPGISQLQVIDDLGIDRDSASYYLRELVKQGRLKAEREGKFTVYRMR